MNQYFGDDLDEIDPNDVELDLRGDNYERDRKGRAEQDSSEDLINKKRQNKKECFNEDGVFIDLNNIIEVACTPQMKQEEERIRLAKIAELERKTDKLML